MITILIVEDQQLVKGALITLLEMEPDFKVIGSASNGVDALNMILELNPDVCLLDIEIPTLTGLEVAERLATLDSTTKILMLTTFAKPGYFQRAMKAKVKGYLVKDSPIEELGKSIRKIHGGEIVIHESLAFALHEETNPLSPQEQTILNLVALGDSNKEIAQKLFLTSGTVRNYLSEILSKLYVKNRVEAISKAKENGWI